LPGQQVGAAISARVAIVGAGPAGSAASSVLAAAGVEHEVLDEGPRSGGNLDRRRFDAPPSGLERGAGPGRFIGGATVLSVTPGRLVELLRDGAIERRRYEAVFLCAGAYDLQLPRAGRWASWSSAGALQALLKGQGIVPQGRVVLAGAGPFLAIVGADLVRAGAQVSDVIDSVPLARYARLLPAAAAQPGTAALFARALARLRRAGTRLRLGARAAAIGERSLRLADGSELPFDRIGVTDCFAPQTQLARTAGCAQVFSPAGRYFCTATDELGRTDRPGIFVCGEGQGIRGGQHARASGALAACAWLADNGVPVPSGLSQRTMLRRARRLRRFGEMLERIVEAADRAIPNEAWVCSCERVAAGPVRQAIAAGLHDLSSIKIVTRCGMGSCQGRYCEPLICRLFAEAGLQPLAPLAQKNLVRPVPAGTLAGA
jgi:NADPH-dependent 2,4-dienoyl-CoA reductase/sulfur reductase-like enzyme